MNVSAQAKEIIGVVPAAGQAVRISPAPCSKEIYPIGLGDSSSDGVARPKSRGPISFGKILERSR